ncbi:MAG: Rid family detoxifying hydrolase [Bacteroidota bacterium]|nr:Rid family detoxifying hydrolase [Bacteroidota bacterium]
MNKVHFNSENIAAAIGPYSHAVIVNDVIYTSGQIALNKEGIMQNQDIDSEIKQVMKNLKTLLEDCGTSMENVVKSTIYLYDIDDFELVNKIYGSYFKGNFPARETVQISLLPRSAKVEISVIAIK